MEGPDTVATVQPFVVLLVVIALAALITRRVVIPYSVALVMVGLAVAILAPASTHQVTPELVLVVLVPGLVFEAAYKMDLAVLRGRSEHSSPRGTFQLPRLGRGSWKACRVVGYGTSLMTVPSPRGDTAMLAT